MFNTEQKLKLQLELSEVLVKSLKRQDIGLELAATLNKFVPFDFFLQAIWSQGSPLGYRISTRKTEQGNFSVFEDAELFKAMAQNREATVQHGIFLAKRENAGIYHGSALKDLSERFPSFHVGYHYHGIRSTMILNIAHKNGYSHVIVISDRKENAFTEELFQVASSLLPQIELAYDNIFRYEKLQQEEQMRTIQLQLNNFLLEHTNRDDFGIALAKAINNIVPCERFMLRIWTGPLQLGYRLPLIRKEDGSFERFSDVILVEQIESDPESAMTSSRIMAEKPGIYQGHLFKKLCDQYPLFSLVEKEYGIHSLMPIAFTSADTTCLLVLGNTSPESFQSEQYELLQLLMPQIILAFDNLFKYEKIKQEERERKTQLELLLAFNSQKDIDEMAVDAIAKINDLIPFEYWFHISTVPADVNFSFRVVYKKEGRFYVMYRDQLFSKINHEPIQPEAFKMQHKQLFENHGIYVGDDFETLKSSNSYIDACYKYLNLNSLMTFPLSTMGKVDTIAMAGSVRKYAFTLEDLESMERIIPYMSMAAQQYFTMYHVQDLTRQLELEKNYLVEEIKLSHNFDEIIGTSPLMKDVFNQISQVASTDSTVLILGETGTGKELIARAIHNQSGRKNKVLVKVNSASLPAQLIESELFGHEKGSFTGALEKRIGKFELANGGTIFLDEIGELPLELQAKLLRVLQEREIERIGGKAPVSLDVRIIAATNRDLETEVAEGQFRSDLFYRLNVFPIYLPALRERKEDIPMLIAHFLQKYCKKMKKPFLNLKSSTIQEMIQYEWPGNIRELENVIEQTVIIGNDSVIGRLGKSKIKRTSPSLQKTKVMSDASSDISEEEVIRVLVQTKGKILGNDGAARILNLRPSEIEVVERRWLLSYLKKTEGRIRGERGAARLIGVNPTTLEARLKKLRITKSEIFKGQ